MSSSSLSLGGLAAQVQDMPSTYLLPLVIGLALLAVVLVLLTRKGDQPKEADAASPVIGDRRAAVLVVDDSAVARAKLRRLFESGGYRVEVAGDGLEALEALGKERYAVLVTDLEMPNMGGIELIATVQGSLETEDLPIIAITGHDELQARVRDYQSLYGIFKKPWQDRELLKRVDALASLPRRGAARATRPAAAL